MSSLTRLTRLYCEVCRNAFVRRRQVGQVFSAPLPPRGAAFQVRWHCSWNTCPQLVMHSGWSSSWPQQMLHCSSSSTMMHLSIGSACEACAPAGASRAGANPVTPV